MPGDGRIGKCNGRPVEVLEGVWSARPACHVRPGSTSSRSLADRPFSHPADTFAFPNDTLWSYARDPVTGRQVHLRRDPPPEYHLRCFVMARSAKQFFTHARFDPEAPVLDAAGYAGLLRQLVRRSPRRPCPEDRRIVFPGYPDLRHFSAAHAGLCRAGLGGAWQSYVQRGHWRMVLPFTRRGQWAEAGRLLRSVRANRAPVVHLFTFPALTINHAIVAYAVEETDFGLRFATYDPNSPDTVLWMDFDRSRREFSLPATLYFIGGRVEAYEVYCGLLR